MASDVASSSAPGERRWPRHLLLWLLGGWLFLSVSMAWVASANFRVLDVERLREADRVYAEIPAGEQRQRDLRYAASEINRYLFSIYGAVNAVTAAAAFALLWLVPLPRRRRAWMAAALGVCLLVAIAIAAWLTPVMIELGREIDFVARDPAPPPVQRFFALHRLDVGMELAKLALIAAVSVALIRR